MGAEDASVISCLDKWVGKAQPGTHSRQHLCYCLFSGGGQIGRPPDRWGFSSKWQEPPTDPAADPAVHLARSTAGTVGPSHGVTEPQFCWDNSRPGQISEAADPASHALDILCRPTRYTGI